jgi:glycosyltransferase involved in cell wall biosynthesis
MRFLFLHPNFPAQYLHIVTALSRNPDNQVVFLTRNQETHIDGVQKLNYQPSRQPRPETHHYIRNLESAVLEGQAVYRGLEELQRKGFTPDIVCGHSGWGPTLFVKDVLPKTPLLCYFEWFYHAMGSDADFDPAQPLSADDYPRIRAKNSPILLDLVSCDQGISPTQWQRSQFPAELQSKLNVLHDGVDTDYFAPKPGAKLVLPNLDLSGVDEIVTHVARGMEPYRGFPQFMRAVALLQKRRPHCHVVVVGSEKVYYGRQAPDGKTYKQIMLEELPDLDLQRLHFVGTLPYREYVKVLQASRAHVYLTRPFVLSWSMLEALACGCAVVGSKTAPVMEIIEEGHNGLLADFFSPEQICDQIVEILEHPDQMAELRQRARETAVTRYALKDLLPQQLQLIADLIQSSRNQQT